GAPLAQVEVTVVEGREERTRTAITDAQGHFEFSDLAPGPHQLSASSGHLAGNGGIVDLVPAERRSLAITLQDGPTLTGRVRDLAGQPVAAAQLSLEDPEVAQAPRFVASERDGIFRFQG